MTTEQGQNAEARCAYLRGSLAPAVLDRIPESELREELQRARTAYYCPERRRALWESIQRRTAGGVPVGDGPARAEYAEPETFEVLPEPIAGRFAVVEIGARPSEAIARRDLSEPVALQLCHELNAEHRAELRRAAEPTAPAVQTFSDGQRGVLLGWHR